MSDSTSTRRIISKSLSIGVTKVTKDPSVNDTLADLDETPVPVSKQAAGESPRSPPSDAVGVDFLITSNRLGSFASAGAYNTRLLLGG